MYLFFLVVSTLIKIHNFSIIIPESSGKCLEHIAIQYFPKSSIVNVISDGSFEEISIMQQTIVLNLKQPPINPSIKHNNNFMIVLNDDSDLNSLIRELSLSFLWDKSLSPRGRFLVIFPDNQNKSLMFTSLWSNDIVKVTLLSKVSQEVFKANPYESNCWQSVNIKLVGKCMDVTEDSLRFPKNFNNCTILVRMLNLLNTIPLIGDANSKTKAGLFVSPFKIIEEALELHVVYENFSDRLQLEFALVGSKEAKEQILCEGQDFTIAMATR